MNQNVNKTNNYWSCLKNSNQDEISLAALKWFEEHYLKMDMYMKQRVKYHVKSYDTILQKVIYTTKDCYKDNMTFNQYYHSVMNTINYNRNDDYLKTLIDKTVQLIREKEPNLRKYSDNDIRTTIKSFIFYQPFLGRYYEQKTRELIATQSRYKIVQSFELDNRYAIDLLIYDEVTKKSIGLQLKSMSFLNVSLKEKNSYYNRNSYAIYDEVVDDIYYLLHDNFSNHVGNNFLTLLNYEIACKCDDVYFTPSKDEWVIEELNEIFDKLSKEDN